MKVLVPGDTCWRTETASRAAFLIDTESYFSAVYEALRGARRSVHLLGWGFDPRTRLFPDGADGPDDPDEIGTVLIALAKARPDVEIRLLIWRSALPISASQEFFPHRARKWFKGTRVQFRLDDAIPFGGCHHQKVLVIDDKVAFCGGGDLGVDRWDTPSHLDGDARRMTSAQVCHAPRHEVMMLVEGAAAAALGDLARERWRLATGEVLEPPAPVESDPWPDHVPAVLRDAPVSIARTAPAWRREQPLAEILNLHLAMIRSARELIYLENQYFTSPLVAEALAARLAEPDGPQVVLISTGQSPSWFDRLTMDRARATLIWRLRAEDVYGRFRAYYPTTPGRGSIVVHSKVAVIDDRLVRIGSANLNNRSAGFDTECDLALEGDAFEVRQAIAAFRDRLAGHFMGVTGDAVAKARARRGGLIGAIDVLDRDRRLAPIVPAPMTPFGSYIAAHHLGDPAGVSDSWRPGRRRDRIYAQARALRRSQIEIHDQRKMIGGGPGQSVERRKDVADHDARTDEQMIDAQDRQR